MSMYGNRAGLGSAGAATNVAPINGYGNMQPERYSLFISNIPQSIDDYWLTKIFESVGTLISIKRPRDANGAAKAFAFSEFGDGESVIRCLKVLHNLALPDGKGVADKRLVVKADEKTRARLDTFESQRTGFQDADEEALQEAQNTLRATLEQMEELGPQQTPQEALLAARKEQERQRNLPAHLQDLAPEELPEASRGIITKEIQFFREQAAKREAAKAQRQANDAARVRGEPERDSGYGSRASSSRRDHPQDYHSSSGRDSSDRGNRRSSAFGPDSQSFAQKREEGGPSFVRSNGTGISDSYDRDQGYSSRRHSDSHHRDSSSSRREPEISDEEQERRRVERIKREAEAAFRDRERRWENRERNRLAGQEREKTREVAFEREEANQKAIMAAKLADWDDHVELERGKDLFHLDRNRWRAQRRAVRAREIDADARDAALEKEQLEKLQKASEDFLNQQADLFDQMTSGREDKSRIKTSIGSGAALDDSTPIRLSVSAVKEKKEKEVAKDAPHLRPSAAFEAAEEEEAAARRKRELVPLNYSDDELEDEEEIGMTSEQKLQRRKDKIQSLVASIPTDKAGLWSWEIRWEKLTEKMLEEKILPFASKKVQEAIGMEEEELVNVVVEHLRSHKSAQELVEELEPVLADEATEFVIKLWRYLVFEILAKTHRISTTT